MNPKQLEILSLQASRRWTADGVRRIQQSCLTPKAKAAIRELLPADWRPMFDVTGVFYCSILGDMSELALRVHKIALDDLDKQIAGLRQS